MPATSRGTAAIAAHATARVRRAFSPVSRRHAFGASDADNIALHDAAPPRAPARGPGRILVVDDLAANIRLLEQLLTRRAITCVCARDGEAALDAIGRELPDLVLSDVRMPRVRRLRSLPRRCKRRAVTRLLPIVLMTATTDPEDRMRAIEAGATDFITKPVDQPELQGARAIADAAQALHRRSRLGGSRAAQPRADDRSARCRTRRVTASGWRATPRSWRRRCGLPRTSSYALARGGYFHDIGKIALPDAILLKPAASRRKNSSACKRAPGVGDRLCGDLRALHHVRPIVRHHHERLDGSGYPDGLARRRRAAPRADHRHRRRLRRDDDGARRTGGAMSNAEAIEELRREVQRGWRRARSRRGVRETEMSRASIVPVTPASRESRGRRASDGAGRTRARRAASSRRSRAAPDRADA